MNYVNTATLAYPVSLSDIKLAHPNVSFTSQPTAAELSPLGYAPVVLTEPPAIPPGQAHLELDPEEVDGTWFQTWGQRAATEAELLAACDYRGFWDALLVSPLYQSVRAQACTDLSVNTACTEFIAAMTDAKFGRANPGAIQACIWLLLQALALDEAGMAELQTLLTASRMELVYSLQPPGAA